MLESMLLKCMFAMVCIPPPGQCKASEQYVDQLKDTLAHSTPKKGVAAFIAEPIQVRL